jgi:hypothetical protein
MVGCPAPVATTWVSATELKATVPAGLTGPPAGTLGVNVYVVNSDGSLSVILPFTAQFAWPVADYQGWTTLIAVCAELPGFKRGGNILDSTIEQWIRSVAQDINAAMIRRGLSLNPAAWQQPSTDGSGNPVTPATGNPAAAGALELINRLGAAARLAGAAGAQFTAGKYGLAVTLGADFEKRMALLEDGYYDKLFDPNAATVDVGPFFMSGDMTDGSGNPVNTFSRESVDGGPPLCNTSETVDEDDGPTGPPWFQGQD